MSAWRRLDVFHRLGRHEGPEADDDDGGDGEAERTTEHEGIH
jgi:hypothetical protein